MPDGDNNISSTTGAYEILTNANAYYKATGRKVLFDIRLAGITTEAGYSKGLFTVKPHVSTGTISKTHLIIISSLNHNYEQAMAGNGQLIYWLVQQYKTGTKVTFICTGAFSGLKKIRLYCFLNVGISPCAK